MADLDHFYDQELSCYFYLSNIETDAFCDLIKTDGWEHPETGSFSARRSADIWWPTHGLSVSYIAILSKIPKHAPRIDCRCIYQVTSYP